MKDNSVLFQVQCLHLNLVFLQIIEISVIFYTVWNDTETANMLPDISLHYSHMYRPCGLVVRVPDYRSRGPGSITGATRFFWEVVGLERGPLSLVTIIEELFQGNSGSGLENRN
jgi:hypothetical protein